MRSEPRTLIIAEAGVNHNGDVERALRLVDTAADAGADAVKFQTFRAEQLVRRDAPAAEYQRRSGAASDGQFAMLKRLEVSEADHLRLIAHAADRGITLLSTPFDVDSLRFLVEVCGLRLIKVSSGDLTNLPFLVATARAAERVILSTGMGTLDEVEMAIGALSFGFSAPRDATPSTATFSDAGASQADALRERVTLLHCTSEYPAPVAEVNLRAMATMAKTFQLPVGYSDHTSGIHIALAAVACGATVIEKHFTLDRALPGPDHAASLEPSELARLVREIRDVELALGDGVKRPVQSELTNRTIVRKSLVAARPIAKGERFSEDNLGFKRPGAGAPPSTYWARLGEVAARAYQTDESIDV